MAACAQIILSQDEETPQLFDLLPLAIGNEWTYRYSSYSSFHGGYYGGCYGTKEVAIVDSVGTADSTVWNFIGIRDMVCEECFQGNCSSDTINDSAPFTLVELYAGLHQLYNPAPGSFDVFPFVRSPIDTNYRVFRYSMNQSLTLLWHGAEGCVVADGSLEFQESQGELSYDFNCNNIDGTYSFSHVLLSSVINAVHPVGTSHDPGQFVLMQNFPNPFNPQTTIRYHLPRNARVSLEVFNLLGERVALLVDEEQAPGSRTVQWDATGQSSGVYFYRLQAGGFVEIRRLVLVR
jgi:hypothetical protein